MCRWLPPEEGISIRFPLPPPPPMLILHVLRSRHIAAVARVTPL